MVAKCYFELRKPAARGTESISADIMRHLNTRQHLGKAVVICGQPAIVLSAARKQWLKLSRSLQKQRSSTLNADKILKYTHTIARMQRMHFTIKEPLEQPNGDIYFLSPDQLSTMPVHCWSVYVLVPLSDREARALATQLPAEALVIDYRQSKMWQRLAFQPKRVLEKRVSEQWRQIQQYLLGHRIDITKFVTDGVYDTEIMDDALDTLLGGHSHKFLVVANEFQRALELSRPLRLKKEVRTTYDSLALLAHRVQALSPGAFSQHFLETYNEDDTFFLYDAARTRKRLVGNESLPQAYTRHTKAGRHNLAKSLQSLAESTQGT